MTDIHEHDGRIREWLGPGPAEAPSDLVEAILAEGPAIRQRHRWEVAPRLELGGRARGLVAARLTGVLLAGLLAIGVFVAGRRPTPLLFSRVPDLTAFAGGSVADAIAWRGQLLAVGSVADAGHTVGTAWTSANGADWARVTPGTATVDVRMAR